MDMVVRLYAYYHKVLNQDNLLMQSEITEPKKRGRKPKTNG